MSSRVEFEQRSSAGGQVFYDRLETRTDAERAQNLARQLPIQVCAAREVPAFAERLREVDAASVTSREALALLPVTRKAELLERQRAGCRAPVAGSAIGSPSAGHASDEIATEDLGPRGLPPREPSASEVLPKLAHVPFSSSHLTSRPDDEGRT